MSGNICTAKQIPAGEVEKQYTDLKLPVNLIELALWRFQLYHSGKASPWVQGRS